MSTPHPLCFYLHFTRFWNSIAQFFLLHFLFIKWRCKQTLPIQSPLHCGCCVTLHHWTVLLLSLSFTQIKYSLPSTDSLVPLFPKHTLISPDSLPPSLSSDYRPQCCLQTSQSTGTSLVNQSIHGWQDVIPPPPPELLLPYTSTALGLVHVQHCLQVLHHTWLPHTELQFISWSLYIYFH